MVEDILQNCRPQTKLCIAANITCEGEYIKTKTVKEWQGKVPDLSKFLVFSLVQITSFRCSYSFSKQQLKSSCLNYALFAGKSKAFRLLPACPVEDCRLLHQE